MFNFSHWIFTYTLSIQYIKSKTFPKTPWDSMGNECNNSIMGKYNHYGSSRNLFPSFWKFSESKRKQEVFCWICNLIKFCWFLIKSVHVTLLEKFKFFWFLIKNMSLTLLEMIIFIAFFHNQSRSHNLPPFKICKIRWRHVIDFALKHQPWLWSFNKLSMPACWSTYFIKWRLFFEDSDPLNCKFIWSY